MSCTSELVQVCKSIQIEKNVQVSLCLTYEKLIVHLHLIMFVSKAKVPLFEANFVLLGEKRKFEWQGSEEREGRKNQPSSEAQYLAIGYGCL